MIRGNYQQKMYWSQNIPHKIVASKRLTSKEITQVQSSRIPKQSDYQFWDVY
jgi:adenine specific DNA methylase Mod